jgi:hypothetical protein
MIRTINQALSHAMFTVVKRKETPGIFQIKFGKIPTVITIKILQLKDNRFSLDASHGIKTELQAGAYWVRYRTYATPGEALDDFRTAFSLYYKPAEREGFRPSKTWLVQRKT